jgi:hypothetical protein
MDSGFSFRKVYADLVADSGEVVVLYLNELVVAGIATRRASLERYAPDGRRTLIHGTVPPRVDAGTALGDLVVQHGDQVWRLEVAVEHGGWTPSTPCPAKPLHWQVLAARTRARLTGQGLVPVGSGPAGSAGTLEGLGYVDWVELHRPTRLLHLHTLQWGRFHLPDATLIVEDLTLGDGQRWQIAAEVRPYEVIEHFPDADLGPDGVVRIDDRTLVLQGDLLHHGDAFDPERVPRWLDRQVCHLASPAWESRWRGTARWSQQTGQGGVLPSGSGRPGSGQGGVLPSGCGSGVWERVTFG